MDTLISLQKKASGKDPEFMPPPEVWALGMVPYSQIPQLMEY